MSFTVLQTFYLSGLCFLINSGENRGPNNVLSDTSHASRLAREMDTGNR